jgi:hypothetical protein
MLTADQLLALQAGHKDGFLAKSNGLVRLRLARKRDVYDEVRHRSIPTGDYCLTGWGHVVAARYRESVERLPVGALINHRIHAYRRGTVVLADDSNSISKVDPSRPLRVRPNHHEGLWHIPLVGGGFTFGSPDEAWYLRNYLSMPIHLDLGKGESADDFVAP